MGNRGPQPGTGGRPRKPLADKMTEGRSKYTSVGIPLPEPVELEGAEMPPPHEFLSDEQKNGQELVANEIYKSTWEWLCLLYTSKSFAAMMDFAVKDEAVSALLLREKQSAAAEEFDDWTQLSLIHI